MNEIMRIVYKHKGCYGYCKVTLELIKHNHKKVRGLIKDFEVLNQETQIAETHNNDPKLLDNLYAR